MKRNVTTVLLGAGVLLSLGFGVTRAAATTAHKQGPYCQTAAERAACFQDCQAQNMIGICDTDEGCYCI